VTSGCATATESWRALSGSALATDVVVSLAVGAAATGCGAWRVEELWQAASASASVTPVMRALTNFPAQPGRARAVLRNSSSVAQ